MKVIVGILIAVLALIVCLVPLKEVAYAVMVDYEDTETYYEDEPYEVTENYTEAVPCDYKVVESYDAIVQVLDLGQGPVELDIPLQFQIGDLVPKGYVVIENTDDTIGTLTVQFTFWSWSEYLPLFGPTEVYLMNKVTADIEPREVATVEFLAYDLFPYYGGGGPKPYYDPETGQWGELWYEPGGWDWEYTITEATKTIEQERTVTKYRQVEKQRTVIKQRQETRYKKVTLLEFLLHYQ